VASTAIDAIAARVVLIWARNRYRLDQETAVG
jgi:hypothetical protein